MERYKDKQLSAYERAAALADTLSTEEQAQQENPTVDEGEDEGQDEGEAPVMCM